MVSFNPYTCMKKTSWLVLFSYGSK